MAELFTDYAQPYELSLTARVGLEEAEQTATLAPYLPVVSVPGTTVTINQVAGGLNEIAEYRAFDAENSFGESGGGSRLTVELPPLGQQERISEYDQLQMRNISNPDLHVNAQLKVAKRLGSAIASRLELARGQVIATGRFTANENGFITDVDYGRDESLNVTAANLWSDASNATPIADISAWVDAYVAVNGEAPGAVRLSRKAVNAAKKTAEIKAMLPANGPQLVTNDVLNTLLAADGLPPIVIYDRKVKKKGEVVDIIDPDVAVLLPNTDLGPVGATAMGTTLESLQPEYAIPEGEQEGIVVGAYRAHNPIAQYLNGAAIGLPVLGNANAFLAATIL